MMDILNNFGNASGLRINPSKSTATPIRCADVDLQVILSSFGGTIAGFPLRYLGLPLTVTRPRLVHLQFILDRVRARLAGWKGRMLSIAGRRVLVRCVLSALPTFALTAIKALIKLIKDINKGDAPFSVGKRPGADWWQLQGELEARLLPHGTWRPGDSGH